MLNIAYSQASAKQMTRLPGNTGQRLAAKINAYAADPQASHGWATSFGGGIVRIRQGDYRAVCRVDHTAKTLAVHEVGHRREVYR